MSHSEKRIPSKMLHPVHVPKEGSSVVEIQDFAYTYNAYEQWSSLKDIYHISRNRLHENLEQLRTCLFVEFRDTWKLGPTQFAEDSPEVEYLRLLLVKIRLCLLAREVVRDGLNKRAEE